MRIPAFVLSAMICGSVLAAEPPGSRLKQPNWDRATFAMYRDGQPNLQISSVRRNGDELFASLSLSNSTYEKRVLPPITVRGFQLSDGSFWPHVKLQVGDDSKGPWETIPQSKLTGKNASVTIPPTLSVFPLRVDFLPFVPFVAHKAWGRVLLPSGESALVDLKELRD
jgi:hypothetical protein